MSRKRGTLPAGYQLLDYRIEQVLGAGGFGVTYLARDVALKRSFAIKEYFPFDLTVREGATVRAFGDAEADYERGLQDFLREAQTLARYSHPGIVGVARIFEANNTAYMVLNYEDGESLRDRIRGSGGRFSQDEIDRICASLLDALELLHDDGTLHRDIAPDNIFIRKNGTPVLLDFGSARQSLHARSRSVSAIVKAGYSPQEQYSSRASNQGPWTDIYAFGATLYRLVTGEAPPEASERTIDDSYEPLAAMGLEGYRPEFLAAVDWALRVSPRQRPQSVGEWRPALMGTASVPVPDEPPPCKVPAATAPAAAAPRRKLRLAGLVAAALALVAVSVAATAYHFNNRIFALTAETDARISELREQEQTVRAGSAQASEELGRIRAEYEADLARLNREISESTERTGDLESELARTESEARAASSAERGQFDRQLAALRDRIRQERGKAESLQLTATQRRQSLRARIQELELQLRTEEAARGDLEQQNAELQRQALMPSIEIEGLELAPLDGDGRYFVRGARSAGLFGSGIAAGEVVQDFQVNGIPLDLADAVQKASMAACDLVAFGIEGTGRTVEIRLPQDYRAVGATSPRRLERIGALLAKPSSGRGAAIVVSVSPGSIADDAGLHPDDRIVSVDDMPLPDIAALEDSLAARNATGGVLPVTVLRDCAETGIELRLPVPMVTRNWMGLSLSGPPAGPLAVGAVEPQSVFAGSGVMVGDTLESVRNRGRSYPLGSAADIDAVPDSGLCGVVQLAHRRDSAVRQAAIHTQVAPSARRVSLADLGLQLAELRDRSGYRVEAMMSPQAERLRQIDLRVDDVIRSLAFLAGGAIAAMTADEQRAFLASGGPVRIERDCVRLDLTLAPQPVEPDDIPPPEAVREARRFVNRDLTGRSFRTFDMRSLPRCEAACIDNEACVAFTFDGWNGKCFLKSSVGTLLVNARSISGVVGDVAGPPSSRAAVRFEYFNGKAFPGRGYQTHFASSRNACEALCASSSSCIAFNFAGQARQCDLFQQAGEYSNRRGYQSGAKRQQ